MVTTVIILHVTLYSGIYINIYICIHCLFIVADNGSLHFWDWKSGSCFQKLQTTVQPGSLDSEAGIFAAVFDMSGCRLITAEADKTIKIYKEDETAVSDFIHCGCSILCNNYNFDQT